MFEMIINNMDGSCNIGVIRDYDREMIRINLLYVSKGNIVVVRKYNVFYFFVKMIVGLKKYYF